MIDPEDFKRLVEAVRTVPADPRERPALAAKARELATTCIVEEATPEQQDVANGTLMGTAQTLSILGDEQLSAKLVGWAEAIYPDEDDDEA